MQGIFQQSLRDLFHECRQLVDVIGVEVVGAHFDHTHPTLGVVGVCPEAEGLAEGVCCLQCPAHFGSIRGLGAFQEVVAVGVADQGDLRQGCGIIGDARASVEADEIGVGCVAVHRRPVATNGNGYLVFGIFDVPFTEQGSEGIKG